MMMKPSQFCLSNMLVNNQFRQNSKFTKSWTDEEIKAKQDAAPKNHERTSQETQSTRYSKPEKVKFSSFASEKKDYQIEPDKLLSMKTDKMIKFTPKEEVTRIKFDPLIRHRLPQMPNNLQNMWMRGHIPHKEPESQYVAVNHNGVTYHLFNAQRMPIGRIAVLCSQYIRGKHKPGYERNNFKNADKCIVVNMGDPKFTGRKRQQKMYRHHTGYAGGLKEKTFKEMLEKSPEQILVKAVLGMLPKNSLR